MLRTLPIALILVGATVAAQADVYRWVDEHGSVHYSDRWVPGSELIKTTKAHPVSSSSSSGSYAASHAADARSASERASAIIAEQNAARAVKQDVAKNRDQQCKDAKERYEKAIQARRIYKAAANAPKTTNADRPVEREYLSEQEADAYRVQARADMQDACGTSAK